MILENGVVRTLDPSLPTARALAIAGERIVGGVGVHETALASPEVVDLGGRCVVPGFTDSHVHFPTWALAQREVKLEDTRTFEEALDRIRAAAAPSPRARGCAAAAGGAGDWTPATEPTRQALDAVTGDTPAALLARDSHSLWLNSAALARADGLRLAVPGGVVELDGDGEPTGVLREESAWQFRDAVVEISDDEYVSAMRDGLRLCAARGVTSVHDKDGWIGALGLWQRLRRESRPHRPRLAVPARRARRPAARGHGRVRLRRRHAPLRLPEGVHGRHARLGDGADGRRQRASAITIARRARRDHPRRRPRADPGGRARDRRPGQPRRARRLRGDAGRVGAARPPPPDRARADAPRPRTRRASRGSASPSRASSATRPPTATSPSGAGPARRTAPTRGARSSTPARSSATAPTRRSRSSTRWPGSSPASCARSTTGPRGTPSRRSRWRRRSPRRA